MKLLSIKLENFQGIRNLEMNLAGRNASIYGDNATGKTTIYNALTWLLFDKASTAAKNFTPKTKGAEGDLHNLDHSAEAVFETDDGRQICLKKTFKEVYKKKRGSAQEEFSGHTVDYTINGVPAKEKEYNACILDLCGGDTEKTKMLAMPDYFPEQLPWDERRKILLEVCGDISDEDILAANPELKELPAYLKLPGNTDKRYTIDEYRKVAAARRKEINRQLTEIPARIDEASKSVPDTAGLDEAKIQSRISDLEAERDQLIQEKADAGRADAASTAIRQQIAEVRIKLAEAEAAHIKAEQEKTAGIREQALSEQQKVAKIKREIEDLTEEIKRKDATASRMDTLRGQLLEEYQKVSAQVWDEGQAICPTCGQHLPEERVEHMRGEFNLRKSEKLAEINARGKAEASKEKIASLREEIKALETQREECLGKKDAAEKQAEALSQSIPAPTQFKATLEYYDLNQKLSGLTAQLENTGSAVTEAQAAIETKIRAVNNAIQAERDKLLQLAEAERRRQRITELENQEASLGAEFEELEKGLYLCDLFTKAKVSALTDRINSRFKSVRFRLFQDQLNGGLKEDCEVMVPTDDGRMVPYAFANNAARINAGLEIIGTLADFWNVSLPVFIDNAESVTRLAEPSGMQIIRLVVSEEDKNLRLEVAA
jgi:DNA repair exonuclease SbcCD ATPase subunit